MPPEKKRIALLHGAGYAGGEIIRLLLNHPYASLATVTSRAYAGKPVWHAHASMRGLSDLVFSAEDADVREHDAVFITAEHGKGALAVQQLLESGYQGAIVDLSADFRFKDAGVYDAWFHFTHPIPDLLDTFQYGLPEIYAPYKPGTRYIANPGCFASGIALSLWPVAKNLPGVRAHVTALTGASGSGTRPKDGTHFPTRDGNVRVYKVFSHQHQPEIEQVIGPDLSLDFVPVSGPWTRGIWGTAHLTLPESVDESRLASWFDEAYTGKPFVRLWPGEIPELRYAVNTPFCDIGWVVKNEKVVIGFAIDNLLKGAASQAVQNLNLILGFPESAGL